MKKLLTIIAILLLIPLNLFGATPVEWDTNPDADYYVVYWGDASGSYTENSENIPKETTDYSILNPDNKDLFISVKAFNICGNSSDYSEELSYSCNPVSVTPGLRMKIEVTVNVVVE